MVTRIVMPLFHEGINEGKVVKWYKNEGDRVERGDPLVGVEIEKYSVDLQAPVSEVLLKILVREGEMASVGELIAITGKLGEEVEVGVYKACEPEKPREVRETKATVEPRKERITASPVARSLAKRYGADLAKISGTGPRGRIIQKDVIGYIEQLKEARRIKETIPLTGIRKITAERMAYSVQTAPTLTLVRKVDFSGAAMLLEMTKKKNVHLTYTAILVKALASALEEHLILNSTIENHQVKIFKDINIGVAVATSEGVVVPVIRNANKKGLSEIALTLEELINKTNQQRLSQQDVSDGTFTLTNLGMFNIDFFTPIINPPESGILGVGRIIKETSEDKTIYTAYLSLSFDHRVTDGVPAAKFLETLAQIIENPSLLYPDR